MDEAFEAVVAENRLLRRQLKALRARVSALDSSRWWRWHPRHVLRSRSSTVAHIERLLLQPA